jgi:magnesium-transporting ATPase (P-type)
MYILFILKLYSEEVGRETRFHKEFMTSNDSTKDQKTFFLTLSFFFLLLDLEIFKTRCCVFSTLDNESLLTSAGFLFAGQTSLDDIAILKILSCHENTTVRTILIRRPVSLLAPLSIRSIFQ